VTPRLSLKGKRSALRAVRIPREVDEALRKEADASNISTNGLITRVLMKYVEWDRFAEDFGFVNIPSQLFRALLQNGREENLSEIAEKLGPELNESVLTLWFKETSIKAFLDMLSLITKHGGILKSEASQRDGHYTIILKHELGQKWSEFLGGYYGGAIRKVFGVAPETETSQFQVMLRFSVNSR
jgi:hypothetical protein